MFLRKALHLATGFRSTRVCHYCRSQEILNQNGNGGSLACLLAVVWFNLGQMKLLNLPCRLSQEWWQFGSQSKLHEWDGQEIPPWKTTGLPSALRMIPGGDRALIARVDPAHTWPIGVGKEFCASAIILLCHLDVWPANTIHQKLVQAWYHFQNWRYQAKETCKLHEFSLKTFKVQSSIGSKYEGPGYVTNYVS